MDAQGESEALGLAISGYRPVDPTCPRILPSRDSPFRRARRRPGPSMDHQEADSAAALPGGRTSRDPRLAARAARARKAEADSAPPNRGGARPLTPPARRPAGAPMAPQGSLDSDSPTHGAASGARDDRRRAGAAGVAKRRAPRCAERPAAPQAVDRARGHGPAAPLADDDEGFEVRPAWRWAPEYLNSTPPPGAGGGGGRAAQAKAESKSVPVPTCLEALTNGPWLV